VNAPLPSRVAFQLATSSAAPPTGDGWLYEVKHDGHRLAGIAGSGEVRLLSRNGYERTKQFGSVFRPLAELGREIVLDGEIAAPDERGVTHLDDLQAAIYRRDQSGLAYFAFDLLHLDGRDLRNRPLVERKALLAEVVRSAGCPQVVLVNHIDQDGDLLFDAVREIGGEGIVAKRKSGAYRSGPSHEWLKTKCSEVAEFIITGFRDGEPGTLEAVTVAEPETLRPQGEVQFGVGRRLRELLQEIRLEERRGRAISVRPVLKARVKFFGRHRSGAIRDGVLQALSLMER
jgi:bifunctional non-homologous end joining protein LigD